MRGRAKPGSPPPFPLTLRAVPAQPRFPGALPEVFTVPGRNPHFTGRKAELDTIRTSQLATLATLAGPLGLPPDPDPEIAVRAVCAELRGRPRWLLIFDNAEDIDHIRPVLPGGAGHVLITTRRVRLPRPGARP